MKIIKQKDIQKEIDQELKHLNPHKRSKDHIFFSDKKAKANIGEVAEKLDEIDAILSVLRKRHWK